MQVGRGQPSAMKLKVISVPRPIGQHPATAIVWFVSLFRWRFLSPHPLSARPLRGRGDGGMIFPRASARVRRQQTSLSRAKNDEIQQSPVINCCFCLRKIVRTRGLCDYPSMAPLWWERWKTHPLIVKLLHLAPLKDSNLSLQNIKKLNNRKILMLHNFSNGHKVVIQTPYKQSLIQNQMIETFANGICNL